MSAPETDEESEARLIPAAAKVVDARLGVGEDDPILGPAARRFEVAAQEFRAHMPQLDDFVFDINSEKFIFIPTGVRVAGTTVNSQVPRDDDRLFIPAPAGQTREEDEFEPAASWLKKPQHLRVVHGSTWYPGRRRLIERKQVIAGGDLVDFPSRQVYNECGPMPDVVALGGALNDPVAIAPYLAHVEGLIPDEFERNAFLDWLAFKVQYPARKINGVLILSGPQGGGKDSLFVPIERFFDNFYRVVRPQDAMSRFNPWTQCLVALINETYSAEAKASELYEELKSKSVTPPEHIPVERKGIDIIKVLNRVSIAITTNHLFRFYVDEDDRRVLAVSAAKGVKDWPPDHFEKLHAWFKAGGWQAVIRWLAARDVSAFNPKALPMTETKRKLISFQADVRDSDEFSAPISDWVESWRYVDLSEMRAAAEEAGVNVSALIMRSELARLSAFNSAARASLSVAASAWAFDWAEANCRLAPVIPASDWGKFINSSKFDSIEKLLKPENRAKHRLREAGYIKHAGGKDGRGRVRAGPPINKNGGARLEVYVLDAVNSQDVQKVADKFLTACGWFLTGDEGSNIVLIKSAGGEASNKF